MDSSNRIRLVRAFRNLSQLALARSCGINSTRLWKIENGYAAPTRDEQAAIAAGLDTSVDRLWPEGPRADGGRA